MDRFQVEVLVEESGPLVRWVIARRFHSFMRRWYDEIYSVGLVAVWQAALSYTPNGNCWSNWASTKIFWAIASYLRRATGKNLLPGSVKREMVSLEALLEEEHPPDWPDLRTPDPAREMEIVEMLARLRQRLGREYLLLEGVMEDCTLRETARKLGISDAGAGYRRKALFARIRAGQYGELIEV